MLVVTSFLLQNVKAMNHYLRNYMTEPMYDKLLPNTSIKQLFYQKDYDADRLYSL
jgi:hypothetical protein